MGVKGLEFNAWEYLFLQFFRLLSGKQLGNKRRTLQGLELEGHQSGGHPAPSVGSRRSSISSPEAHPHPGEGKGGLAGPRKVSLAPLTTGAERLPTGEAPGGRKRGQAGLVTAAADDFQVGNGAVNDETPAEANMQRLRNSFSLASSESYFEVCLNSNPHVEMKHPASRPVITCCWL